MMDQFQVKVLANGKRYLVYVVNPYDYDKPKSGWIIRFLSLF